MDIEQLLQDYDYTVPPHLIAQAPATPRDSAKLLIYDRATGKVQHDTFRNLAKYLPPHCVMVFNETKVIPARLILTKETGGKVSILYLGMSSRRKSGSRPISGSNLDSGFHRNDTIKVMANRKLRIGQRLLLSKTKWFTVVHQEEQYFFLQPSFPIVQLPTILQRYGVAPLPPYIKHSPLSRSELKKQYQTIFARNNGSVAAPTASLHFTKRLLHSLKAAAHDIAFITLHVNLGTFATLTNEQLQQGKLHTEQYEIPSRTAKLLNTAKAQGRPIVAVGTTVVRALESAAGKLTEMPSCTIGTRWHLEQLKGSTDMFIRPGYKFKFVDHLITNFHVPKSSLMMLVAAMTGREKLLELYQDAISHEFRFFSFGDGMLII